MVVEVRQVVAHNTTPYPCECTQCGTPLMRPRTAHWHARCDDCKAQSKRQGDEETYRRIKRDPTKHEARKKRQTAARRRKGDG